MPFSFDALSAKKRAISSTAVVTIAAVALSTLAITYKGIATADLKLDDGGVWVTNSADLLVGHLNYPSRILDGATRTRPGEFDLLQQANTILIHNTTDNALTVVDPAAIALGAEAALPEGSNVALGTTTLGIYGSGMVWAANANPLAVPKFDEETALTEIGDGAIAVSYDGTKLFAVSKTNAELLTFELDPVSFTPLADPTITSLDELASDATLSITTVGSQPVILDAKNGALFFADGKRTDIPEARGAILQQPADTGNVVAMTAATTLVVQPLDASTPAGISHVPEGVPSAPVALGSCVYSVWSGSNQYVRDCADDTADASQTIDAATGAILKLRTNNRVVVINDTLAGTVWLVDQDMMKVENWDDLIPPPDIDADEEESQEEQPQFDLPDRSADNRPPTAVDDEYGVRAGRTTLLRVTENDTDPDGDLLQAKALTGIPEGYTIESVLGGAALQLTAPENASGSFSFSYEVNDGRDGTDQASVLVQVRPPEVNEAPLQKKTNTVKVEVNATVTATALDGWIDPDGDDIYLKHASVEGGDTLTFRSNGTLEYKAASGEIGIREVKLVVSDGTNDAEGILRIDVRAKGTVNPIANADHVTATAGIPVTISPLDNDVSPSGAQLRLAKHDHAPGATITMDAAAGTLTFLANNQGTYYIQYLVSDGPHSVPGIIRVDVVAPSATDLPPIAVRDLAMLPTGREVLVDVLANDSDPGGGILVVQSARVTPGSAISVEVLEHSVIRVTDIAGLSAPTSFEYTVSNGTQSATGEVIVMPIALPEKLNAPVTVDDRAIVRVGDVVTLNVIANDSHPDGDTIRLMPELVETDVTDPKRIFIDGNNLRFHAGNEPGTVHATYQIEDSQQNRTAGYVTIQILPLEGTQNSAPRPKPVVARAVEGNTIRIPIPLDGIDPDGDSVELIGLRTNPEKGYATVADAWITYEAYPGVSGRDTFTYLVRDRQGAEAEGTITVGVALQGFENQAPYAVKDVVTVKPGRKVAVPVTVNDSDPDGDQIALVTDGLEVPPGIDADVVDGRVVVTAPASEGEYTITYAITDTFGAKAFGPLVVRVDPNAEPQAPIARDDRVQPQQVVGTSILVNVLENDEDPDGTVAALTVRTEETDVTVTNGALRIPVLEQQRIVRYSVTDEDGLTAQAFVFMPGSQTIVPALTVTKPIDVISGETVELKLADYVHVRADRAPRVAVADTLRAHHSNGASLLIDEHTLTYTSADGYFGPDSIGVQVTDGTGPDDPNALTAYLSIPIRVLPATPQSPTLRNAAVTVAPGEGEVELSLRRLSYDPDEGDIDNLTYTIESDIPTGYKARIDGQRLIVSADASVSSDTTATLQLRVTDGVTEPGTGIITIKTVVSERPFPVANDDTVQNAQQGRTETVDVLANDFNPFADRGPLRIINAYVATGTGEVTHNGERLEITPGNTFVGTMVVIYRITDATASPSREAEARVTLTVLGKPDAPGVPTVTSIQSRTVVLSWATPANNGAPISHYTVTSPQGFTQQCASTTCTLTGLTNDVEYTFTVTATNTVGESDPSPASAPARPDARPDTPAPPTLTFGDRSLTVNWVTPNTEGSPVTSYNLTISGPTSGATQINGVTGNSHVWTGLENGAAYTVQVQAVNRAPDPSEWSAPSAPEIPAGIPNPPAQPTGSFAPSVGSQAQVNVTWPALTGTDTNGDDVSLYEVQILGGNGVSQSQTTSGTSANFTVETSTNGYRFIVRAQNKAPGWSSWSAESAPVRAANAPDAPVSVTISPTGSTSQLSTVITPGALNGNAIGDISWYWTSSAGGGGWVNVSSASASQVAGTIDGAPNGVSQSVTIHGVSGIAGDGAATTSGPAKPYGPLLPSTIESWADGDRVCFRWNLNPALNGQTMREVLQSFSGATSGGDMQGTTCRPVGWNTTGSYNLTLRTHEGGERGYSASATTGSNPAKQAVISKGGSAQGQPGCGSAGCAFINFELRQYSPNTTYTVWYHTNGAGGGGAGSWHNHTVTTDSNGNGSRTTAYYGYTGSTVWVEVSDGTTSNSINW